jgi:1-acyl-sn-glycerol-3-phosphate acyltransferase
MGFLCAGISLRVKSRERIRGGAVYACNHTSHLDAPAMYLAMAPLFPRVRVIYKAELRKLPVLVWVFDAAGFVPIERGNPAQSRPAVERAAEAVQAGHAFFIFPEGTRNPADELLPFKKGGFIMAIRAQAPIVPVVIRGARAAMRKGSLIIRPATIEVTFLEPVSTAGLTIDDRDRVIAVVRDRLQAQLPGGSTGPP